MQTVLLVLAATTALAWLEFVVDAARGRGQMADVRDLTPLAASPAAVSVVVAARNEEGDVERAVRSMLALEYEELEVVAVNDRSDDETGAILDRLADEQPDLRVAHVSELPAGWLGKNHALHVGARLARGDLLLFTDADVIFDPSALGRAMRWATEQRVDHLAGATDVTCRTPGVALFVATFALFFNGYFRPWRARSESPRWYVGFGGFNLVRRSAYERAGGHAALALDPLDDVNLGRNLKRSGARQACAMLGPLAHVEWYPDLPSAIRGLEKNTMAAVGWSPLFLAAGAALQLLMTAWPFLAVWLTSGSVAVLYGVAVALILAVHAAMVSQTSLPRWTSLALPFGVLVIVYTYARSAWLTYRRGGIRWRGTFYSLAELRAAAKRER